MVTRVGVVGATGRMGTAICGALRAEADLELVAGVARRAGTTADGVAVGDDLAALTDAGVEVVVDVTNAAAARTTVPWCADRGLHVVVGTSGWTEADLDAWRGAFTRSSCLVAPNFAIGAVLLMRFAELAAPFFDSAEVVELHHDAKADAPSGTALATVARMAAASADWAPYPTRH